MHAKQVCCLGLFFNFFVLLLNWFLKQIYADSQILQIPPIPKKLHAWIISGERVKQDKEFDVYAQLLSERKNFHS